MSNGVSEILKNSDITQWKYVNSLSNPADLTSRGVKVDSFLRNGMWLHGPTFLVQPQEEWPVDPTCQDVMMSNDLFFLDATEKGCCMDSSLKDNTVESCQRAETATGRGSISADDNSTTGETTSSFSWEMLCF